MYTKYEVRQLLEEAFEKGYNNGIDDTLDYIEENYELEDEFDLMDEYNNINSFNEVSLTKAVINAKNFIKYRDPEQRRIANRADIATVGRTKAAINADRTRNEVYGTSSTGRHGQTIDFRKEKEKVSKANERYYKKSKIEDKYKEKLKSYVPETQPKRKPVLVPRLA